MMQSVVYTRSQISRLILTAYVIQTAKLTLYKMPKLVMFFSDIQKSKILLISFLTFRQPLLRSNQSVKAVIWRICVTY